MIANKKEIPIIATVVRISKARHGGHRIKGPNKLISVAKSLTE